MTFGSDVLARLGSYRIIKKLASGGMADIFLTEKDGVEYVIKTLRHEHAAKTDFQRMFEVETDLALSLRHPNIVRAIETGVFEGVQYLVLERLSGADLRTIIKRERREGREVPASIALRILTDLLAALEYAHRARDRNGTRMNLVHRDVSPQNLFVTSAGKGVLIDFGVARVNTAGAETEHGTLKGKLSYMAPEQIRHEPFDHRADLYAVGIMLYELLLGRKPYPLDAAGDFVLMLAISQGRIQDPRTIAPNLHPSIVGILRRALALKPADRFASASEFQEALVRASVVLGPVATHEQVAALVPADERSDISGASLEADSTSNPSIGGGDIRALEMYGDVPVVILGERLSENFRGAALGKTIVGSVVVDARAVKRVTSFGVREWLSFLDETRASCSLILSHCPVAFARQAAMVRGFLQGPIIASVEMPMLCSECSHGFEISLRPSTDEPLFNALLARRKVPEAICPRCGGTCLLDEQPDTFNFVVPHLGVQLDPQVASALDSLEHEAALPQRPVEKWVTSRRTVIRVSATAVGVRWKEILEGVEGKLALELGGKQSEAEFRTLLSCLRKLEAVDSVSLSNCSPSEALTFLRDGHRQQREVVQISELKLCVPCGDERLFESRSACVSHRGGVDFAEEDLPPLLCTVCGKQVRGPVDLPVADATVVDAELMTLPYNRAVEAMIERQRAEDGRKAKLRYAKYAAAGIVVGLLAAVAAVRWWRPAPVGATLPSASAYTAPSQEQWQEFVAEGTGPNDVAAARAARGTVLRQSMELLFSSEQERAACQRSNAGLSPEELGEKLFGQDLERISIEKVDTRAEDVTVRSRYRIRKDKMGMLRALPCSPKPALGKKP